MNADRILEMVQAYFDQKPEISAVIVYGSVAENRIKAHSDVDIAYTAVKKLSMDEILTMNADLQILLRRDIDLVDLDQAKGLIHYKIMTKGKRLSGTSRELAEHYIRAIDFGTDFLPQLKQMQRKRIERSLHGS